jgi:hypothetical protein
LSYKIHAEKADKTPVQGSYYDEKHCDKSDEFHENPPKFLGTKKGTDSLHLIPLANEKSASDRVGSHRI